MSKNLIYLCNKRLGDLDGILPVLMELKVRHPETNVIIVFYSDRHREVVQQNYILWEALQTMGPFLYSMRGRNKRDKFIVAIRLIRFILRLAFKENIIMQEADVLPCRHVAIKILRALSKVTQIKTYLSIQSPELTKNIRLQSELVAEKLGKVREPTFLAKDDDYFLSAFNLTQSRELFNIGAPEKIIKAGFTRRLPEWKRYIEGAIKRSKIIDGTPYFLYILSYTEKRSNLFEEPEILELLDESLQVFKRYNDKIKTIFKPHTKTDMKRFTELLKKINYSNYIIDYSHPFVLSSNAKFVFGNVYSCIMFDTYYQARPVVEYCQYDPELFHRLNRQSLGGRYCDFFIHRDRKKLEEVLGRLINEDVKIVRDPDLIKKSFPDTPKEFYEVWDKLLY